MGRRASERLASKAVAPAPKITKPVCKLGGSRPPKVRKSKPTDSKLTYTVESIVDKRVYMASRKIEYQVKWKGYHAKHNTWEPLKHLENCPEVVREFEQKLAAKVKKPKPRANHLPSSINKVHNDYSTSPSPSEEIFGSAQERERSLLVIKDEPEPEQTPMPSTSGCGAFEFVRRKLNFGGDQSSGKS